MPNWPRTQSNCPRWEQGYPPNDPRVDGALLDADARAQLTHLPTNAEICELHRLLFAPFVPLDYYAGAFRQLDRVRPCLASNVEVDGIAGTHFRLVVGTMSQLEDAAVRELRELRARWPQLPPPRRPFLLARFIAGYVGHFIRIHPFCNGNGRLSRLLVRWMLDAFGIPPIWEVDPRPPPPYAGIMSTSMRGDDGPLAMLLVRHMQHVAQQPPP